MQRIMIIGPGNAGKSTLAIEMGRILNLPVYHLDKLYWLSGWVAKERELFNKEQAELVSQDKWIIEGDFKKSYDLRAERADTIIFLNLPRRIIIPRFFKRVYRYRGQTRPDMTEGNQEKVNREYLKWLFNYNRSVPRGLINKYQKTKKVYVLNSSRDIKAFVASLKQLQEY